VLAVGVVAVALGLAAVAGADRGLAVLAEAGALVRVALGVVGAAERPAGEDDIVRIPVTSCGDPAAPFWSVMRILSPRRSCSKPETAASTRRVRSARLGTLTVRVRALGSAFKTRATSSPAGVTAAGAVAPVAPIVRAGVAGPCIEAICSPLAFRSAARPTMMRSPGRRSARPATALATENVLVAPSSGPRTTTVREPRSTATTSTFVNLKLAFSTARLSVCAQAVAAQVQPRTLEVRTSKVRTHLDMTQPLSTSLNQQSKLDATGKPLRMNT
jgi:hypothetical protein